MNRAPATSPAPVDRLITAADGHQARIRWFAAAGRCRAALYWLPALGVGLRPNDRFAALLAARGIAVAVHEWRGLGDSTWRAARRCDWGYRELIADDIPAGLAAARDFAPQAVWLLGGHSLGAQFALLYAALHRTEWPWVVSIAGGHPWWRGFPGSKGWLFRAMLPIVPLAGALAGYFPGTRLGFAGREARRLMNTWAATARTGGYPADILDLSPDRPAPEAALAAWSGRVFAAHFRDDKLVSRLSLGRLQALMPKAEWTIFEYPTAHPGLLRADHFGWLKTPEPVVAPLTDWLGGKITA